MNRRTHSLGRRRQVSRTRNRRLLFEQCEDRRVLAVSTWTGGGDNDLWSNPANWDTVPVDGSDVRIAATGNSAEVLFDTSVAGSGVTINSLTSDGVNPVGEPLRITGDTLTLSGAGPFALGTGVTIASGTFSAANAVNIDVLALGGGELSGSGVVTVSGLTTWSGGTMTGMGTTQANGGLTLSGTTKTFTGGRTLNNAGAATWSAGDFNAGGGAIFNNTASGTFDAQFDGAFSQNQGGVQTQFNNAGTFTKSGGAGSTAFVVAFNNSNTVNVNSGTLNLASGGASTGDWAIAATGELRLPAGPAYLLDGGTDITGAGLVHILGGTVNAGDAAADVVNVARVRLTSGLLQGAGALNASQSFQWDAGAMAGSGTTTLLPAATATISGGGDKFLGRTLVNQGTINHSGANFIFGLNSSPATAIIDNSSVFNSTGGGFIIRNGQSTSTAHAINNSGTFNRLGADATQIIGIPFNNSGSVDVQAGTLHLMGGGNHTGSFDVAGATLRLEGASTTFSAASSIAGGGTVEFVGGTTTVDGTLAASTLRVSSGIVNLNTNTTAANLEFVSTGGTLQGAGAINVTSNLNWAAGTMTGAGITTVLSGATVSNGGGGDKFLGRTLVNQGTFNHTGPNFVFGVFASPATGVINNSGVFNATAGVPLSRGQSQSTSHAFNNSGAFNLSGAGTTEITGIEFTNSGTVNVLAGTLHLAGGFTNFGGSTLTGGTYHVAGTLKFPGANIVTNAASIILDGATSQIVNQGNVDALANFATNAATGSFSLQGGRNLTTPAFINAGNVTIAASSTFSTAAGNYTQTGGTTTLQGTLDPAGIVNIEGGTLAGTGTVQSDLTNAGTVSPGTSPGSLRVEGVYTQTSAGTLNVEAAGSTPGTGFDQLVVTGNAALGGTVNVTRLGGFVPAGNDVLRIVSAAGSRTGEFATLNGAAFPGGRFALLYDGSGALLDSNITPTPANDTDTTPEDQALTTSVLTNDTDPDGDALTVVAVASSTLGLTPVINANGAIAYTPPLNFHGSDSYAYTVRDPAGNEATATVTITITPVNDPPQAVNDSATTAEDTPAVIAVRTNDSDIDGDTLSVTAVTQGANGSVAINADGTATYSPALNFHGSDSFTYTVADPSGATSTASVNVTITPVNDPPQAINDVATTAEEAALPIAVRTNDADIDGDALSVTGVTQGANGSVAINPDGTVTYTPALNFHGADNFSYTVADPSGATSTATVNVIVTPVNDAPVAVDDTAATGDGVAVTVPVLNNDSDIDGDALAVATFTQGANGTVNAGANGTLVYTPNPDFIGPDSFTYQATDGQHASNLATVSITVLDSDNRPPTALDDTVVTDEDNFVDIAVLGNDSDPDGNPLSIDSLAQPAHGVVAINANDTLRYTPALNYHGPDSFNYTISDGQGAFATTTVNITVNPLNDRPVLGPISNKSVEEGQTLTFTATASDIDLPPDTLTFSFDGVVPAGASIDPNTGVFTWTPTEAQGPGSFELNIIVGDGSLGDLETVVIIVAEVNLPPALDLIGNKSVDEGQQLSFIATASDPDLPPNALTFSLGGIVPAGATIDPTSGVFNWIPTETQGPGSSAVVIRVSDGQLEDSETIIITVAEVNLPPVLEPIGNRFIEEGQTLSFTAIASDPDLPPNTLNFSFDSGAPIGASIDPTSGVFTWTPTEAQGPSSSQVTIRVSDGDLSDSETITINVTEVNMPPVLDPIGNRTVDEGQTLSFTATASDPDSPPNSLSFSLDAAAPAGASIDPNTGVFTWTPTEDQGPGSFQVTVRASDGDLSDFETITIDVAEHDAPTEFDLSQTNRASLVVDPTNPNQQVLLVVGSDASETLIIERRRGNIVQIRVKRTGRLLGAFHESRFERIAVFGLGGHDALLVDSKIKKPVELHGGSGNDVLHGGSGHDALFGEDGNDSLFGRVGNDLLFGGSGNDNLYGGRGADRLHGELGADKLFGEDGSDLLLGGLGNDRLLGGRDRDLLIGGQGTDHLQGQEGEDLLIGGWTTHDENESALLAILSEWNSRRSREARVQNLTDGTGGADRLNESFFLQLSSTVFGDNSRDQFPGLNERGQSDWRLS